ncbi:tautomerase family protein [Paracoccus contaminans]|uniref:tautomerase family protein n=1 Tax=Paracoccus contaminans TaxID=1945662 RepID=UPI0019816902|nr:tautomerase family protein [Paracoccus contaminans]
MSEVPIVRIELFPGRDRATLESIARDITQLFEKAGVAAAATTILFSEVAPTDWFVAGKSLAAATNKD